VAVGGGVYGGRVAASVVVEGASADVVDGGSGRCGREEEKREM
jgi:hypothetical protein